MDKILLHGREKEKCTKVFNIEVNKEEISCRIVDWIYIIHDTE
jgi:hypothetical protein